MIARACDTFVDASSGIMGEGMANRLLQAGRKLVVWNRGREKCIKLAEVYPSQVTVVDTPGEVKLR